MTGITVSSGVQQSQYSGVEYSHSSSSVPSARSVSTVEVEKNKLPVQVTMQRSHIKLNDINEILNYSETSLTRKSGWSGWIVFMINKITLFFSSKEKKQMDVFKSQREKVRAEFESKFNGLPSLSPPLSMNSVKLYLTAHVLRNEGVTIFIDQEKTNPDGSVCMSLCFNGGIRVHQCLIPKRDIALFGNIANTPSKVIDLYNQLLRK
ncbi:hypothetical protein [Plesiomonas sp.]|uniref:hypothetical protein n=1 Tax=Plesiomonas sp. TaxID=2486279 RepID=UPI003F4086EA